MGSYLDSLRFRKEVAKDISVRRQKVHCFMVGEHGFNIVPLWSNVHVYSVKEDDLTNTLKKYTAITLLSIFQEILLKP